jgi:uncharacterized protein (UPF0332 family)
MELKELDSLLKNKDKLDKKIQSYINRKSLSKVPIDKAEISGHLEKARHNLSFVKDNIELGYIDWAISGGYYAVYHATLALILAKGYSSKNHDATLCVAIKEYYGEGIFEEDITLINYFFLTYQDLLFYIDSKEMRHNASYSTKLVFDRVEVEELRKKAINYINKVEAILGQKGGFR